MNYKNFGKNVYFQFQNKKTNLNIIIHETDIHYYLCDKNVTSTPYYTYLKEYFIEL